MKVIKVYQKECTGCGLYKREMERVNGYAASRNLVVQVVRTPLNPKLYEEANKFGIPQPFAVIDGEAYPLGELPGDKLVKRNLEAANKHISKKFDIPVAKKGE